MKIRQEQLDAFFVHDLVEHVRRYLPDQYRALGEHGARQAVEHGMGRARSHGFLSNPGVRAYVQVMFVLGPDFDADPELDGARQALAEPTEIQRVRALVAAAESHLRDRLAQAEGRSH